jgi:hypothetical protein
MLHNSWNSPSIQISKEIDGFSSQLNIHILYRKDFLRYPKATQNTDKKSDSWRKKDPRNLSCINFKNIKILSEKLLLSEKSVAL